jgi:hypothetical protein
MLQRRFRWAAVAMFAAVMTVAEVFAITAGARDARRWLESDQVREVQQAGRAVAAAVTGAAHRECNGRDCVKVRVVSAHSVREAVREARRQIEEVRMERITDSDI